MSKNKLQVWLTTSTAEQREKLAAAAGTTLGALRHAAGGYRSEGEVRMSAEMAARVEKASRKIKGVEPLDRGDLCPACRVCDLRR